MTRINIVNTYQADNKSTISWEIYDSINDGISMSFSANGKGLGFSLHPSDAEELAKNLMKAAKINRKSYHEFLKYQKD